MEASDIRVCAYSYGAGYGFIQLARQLEKRGLSIESAVLSDPVRRFRWTPWRALWSLWEPHITVPANVREVWYGVQRMNRPHGHHLVAAETNKTIIHPFAELMVTHQYADDHPEFHKQAKAYAKKSKVCD
jgi:hypothetical protein